MPPPFPADEESTTLPLASGAAREFDVLQSPRRRKAFLMMSRHPERMRERILREMNRGVTVFRNPPAAAYWKRLQGRPREGVPSG